MTVSELLSLFDLTPKHQVVYLELLKTNWITVLELSRKLNIKRTSLYRLIEELLSKGIVEKQLDDKTTFYRAADPQSLDQMIDEQRQKLAVMQQGLELLTPQLQLLRNQTNNSTSVRFYRGLHGLKTLEWKMVEEANIEMLVFGTGEWDLLVGHEFAEKIRTERVNQNIHIRELLNPDKFTLINDQGQADWTNNRELILNHYLHRQIDPSIFHITNEILIFPQRLILLSLGEDEPIGIELSSPHLSQMMRQLFEVVWLQGVVRDKFGS
ncbi:MAG TPA: helix-turn-helix domain-containing protein [Vitreimonas sp.]|nr:helix-turn-helix domain-containing protein [Vitreimonas sp.]